MVSGCKIQVTVPEGGSVTTLSGDFECMAGETCTVDVRDLEFDETFVARPDKNKIFLHWKKRPRGFFGGSQNPKARLFTSGFKDNAPLMSVLESDDVFFLEPVFVDTGPESMWTYHNRQLWTGEDIVEGLDYCKESIFYGYALLFNFDINLDGQSDFLLPTTCYQTSGIDPESLHNVPVVSAWKFFCSDGEQHRDCTQDLFGSEVVNGSGLDSDGGSPVLNKEPEDVNGDGYPDFIYALHRDDGRRGADFNNPDDLAFLIEACGGSLENPPDDCTRMSVQSVMLSSPDGRYTVVPITAWGRRNTGMMLALPNNFGTHDLLGINYGPFSAARIRSDNSIVDTTKEFSDYKNIDIVTGNPYGQTFAHEGEYYVVTGGVAQIILDNPNDSVFTTSTNEERVLQPGFSLWRWVPGEGFYLSDFHVPEASNLFRFKLRTGEEVVESNGAYIRGIPVYEPKWHYFSYAQLHPEEEPILVVAQEAATTVGQYFRAKVVPEAIYTYPQIQDKFEQFGLYSATVYEGFYVRSGKLTKRPRSILEGDYSLNMPKIYYGDLDGDGKSDGIGMTGWELRAKVYLNDGRGTLKKLDTSPVWPEIRFTDGYNGNYAGHIMNLGRTPFLDFAFYGVTPHSSNNELGKAQELSILRAKRPVTELRFMSPGEFQRDIQECFEKINVWVAQCELY